MANFPTSATVFTTKSAGQTIQPSHINDLQDEVAAIEDGYLNGTARLNAGNSTLANLSVSGGSSLGNAVAQSMNVDGGSTLRGAVTMNGAIAVSLSSGDNNDLAPVGFSTAFCLRLEGSTAGSTLSGIAAPTAGRLLLLVRTSTTLIGLKNDAGSAAQNRLQMRSNSDTTFSNMLFWYDNASNRWLQVG